MGEGNGRPVAEGQGAPAALPTALPEALIVAGPTASGKSVLALALAEALGGVVINADAMQVYRELRVLTARPSAAEEARAPHYLYGVRPATEAGNVAWWRGAALAAMTAARADGRLPILCGGSGMYLSALTEGVSEIPDPGGRARAEARALLAELGPAGLHTHLAANDPATAFRLRPTDAQRIARAWEVWAGTGRGLAAWQAGPRLPPAPFRFRAVLLDPPRPALRAAIAARFAHMLAAGALEEVRALLAQSLNAALPAMRAHGVPDLAAHLRGEITLEEAAAQARAATGQYTKRQATWFRHHPLAPSERVRTIRARMTAIEQFSHRDMADLFNFVRPTVDAPQHPP